jgi:putative FmdB family regulatory protein
MPTYDYLCDACGHRFSAQQRFGDEPLPACPKCGARPRRLVSLPAIVFKGGGWYATDSRRAKDGGGPEGGADAPAKPSEGSEQQKSRGGASSDGAKPAEKSKPKDSTTKESASEKADGSAETP